MCYQSFPGHIDPQISCRYTLKTPPGGDPEYGLSTLQDALDSWHSRCIFHHSHPSERRRVREEEAVHGERARAQLLHDELLAIFPSTPQTQSDMPSVLLPSLCSPRSCIPSQDEDIWKIYVVSEQTETPKMFHSLYVSCPLSDKSTILMK